MLLQERSARGTDVQRQSRKAEVIKVLYVNCNAAWILKACLEQFRHTPPQSERGPRHQQTKAGQAGFTELRMSRQGTGPASTHQSSNTELATAQKRPQRGNQPTETRDDRRIARGQCPHPAYEIRSRSDQWEASYCSVSDAIKEDLH